jgi:hypothetical protein
MAIGDRYKTGDISPANAYYEWDGYTDGTRLPLPTAEEQKIPLDNGETFPPIRSCNKGAFWRMTSYK